MPEEELKERLAQKLFEDMLREEGYEVHKLDYEGAFQEIVNLNQDRKYPEFLHDLQAHRQDFLVGRKDEMLLVRVRFSSQELDYKKMVFDPRMGNAIIVFMTPSEPCFRIAHINEFAETGVLRPLDNNEALRINERTVVKYSKIIEQKFS